MRSKLKLVAMETSRRLPVQRKTNYSERIAKTKKFIGDVFSITTVHGVVYLTKEGLHIVERYTYDRNRINHISAQNPSDMTHKNLPQIKH